MQVFVREMTQISVECPKDNHNLQLASRHQVNDVIFVLITMSYGKSDEGDLNEWGVLSDRLIS